MTHGRRGILLVSVLGVLAVGAVGPAAGSAGTRGAAGSRAQGALTGRTPLAHAAQTPTWLVDLGSNQADPANLAGQSPEDWAAWVIQEVFGFGTSTRQGPMVGPGTVGANGQILWFDVKGMAMGHAGAPPPSAINGGTAIHLVDLVPLPDGRVRVDHTSQTFNLPDTGDPQQISRFYPENFCVHAGDYVGLASEGGFDATNYPHGVPLQIFSRMANWSIDFYSKHNDIMNGHVFAGGRQDNAELLMHEKEGTGGFATPLCPDGTAGTPAGADPLTIVEEKTDPGGTLEFVLVLGVGNIVTGKATVLPGATTASRGPVALTARRRHHRRLYAQGSVTTNRTGPVVLKLMPTRKGTKTFARRSDFTVSVHLAFRSSAKLGSTAKSKDFRLKIKGKGKGKGKH